MDELDLRSALRTLGETLSDRGVAARVAIIGGAALLLAEGLLRPTQDVDVVAASTGDRRLRKSYELPEELAEAARDVARVHGLDDDWLNAGALGAVFHSLPEGFEERLRSESFGNALIVSVAAREDLIRLKLLAAHDEGPYGVHFEDLLAIGASSVELHEAAAWVRDRFPGGPHPGLDDLLRTLERASRG
jgi:hypothetical protein